MKRLIGLSVLLSALFPSKSFAQYEGTVGLGIHVRFAPSFTCYIPSKGNSMWEADADAHYIVPLSWLFSFYPVAGLNYSNRKFDASKASDTGLQDWTKHRIGANPGLGLQYDFGYKKRVSIEYKYWFIKDFSQSFFTAGIGSWI